MSHQRPFALAASLLSATLALQERRYGHPGAFRDIASGSAGHYPALPGWDFSTGLGVPGGPGAFAP